MRLLDGCLRGASLTLRSCPPLRHLFFKSANLVCDLSSDRLLYTPHVGRAKVNAIKAIEPSPSALPKPRELTLVRLQVVPDRLLNELQRLDGIYTECVANATLA
jgi:hypothetical protein